MSVEFYVRQCHVISGVGLFISGKVGEGEISEGIMGKTFKGKRFTLVKIEKAGFQIPKAVEDDKVNLTLKGITREDLKPGETIFFG